MEKKHLKQNILLYNPFPSAFFLKKGIFYRSSGVLSAMLLNATKLCYKSVFLQFG